MRNPLIIVIIAALLLCGAWYLGEASPVASNGEASISGSVGKALRKLIPQKKQSHPGRTETPGAIPKAN